MKNIFNNRELSILIWFAVAIALMMLSTSIRKALFHVFATALSKTFIVIYSWMVFYLSSAVYLLYKIGLWDSSQIKNTVIWLLSVGLITLFNISKVNENKHYFKDALKDTFRFTAVLEFVVGFYTFSLVTELIFIPIIVFLSIMLPFAERNKEHAQVKKALNSILSLIGLFLIGYAVYRLASDFKGFATTGTLTDFLVPPILSLLFLPFIYTLSLYMTYETNFIGVKFALKNPILEKFARRQARIHFNFQVNDLERWRISLFRNNISTKEDIIASIKEVKRLKQIERNPPEVTGDLGWSPYKAKDFLMKEGITTRYYQNAYENEWGASSNQIDLKDADYSNNIAYYVEGNSQIATKLQLSLNVNSPEVEEDPHAKLLSYSKALYNAALKKNMPENVENAILFGQNIDIDEDYKRITVSRENWPSHRLGGYNVTFKIDAKSI